MQQQETWDQLYKRKRQEQRELRGAKVKYQQIRQEIANLAIAYLEETPDTIDGRYAQMVDTVTELRKLEQQYPNIKELSE